LRSMFWKKVKVTYLVLETAKGPSTKNIRALVRSSNDLFSRRTKLGIVKHNDINRSVSDLKRFC
jgi:hypothetical protein